MDNEFRVGNVLSQSIDVMKSNFLVMLLFAVLNFIPSFVDNILADNSFLGTGLIYLLGLFLPIFLQGAMVFGVYQFLTGSPFSASLGLRMVQGRFWHLLGLAVFVSVISVIGILFLIIPGVIILLVLYVAIPALLVENVSIGGAMQRSKDLTSGRLWRLFGLTLILSLIYCLLVGTSLIVTYAVGAFSFDPDVVDQAMSLKALLITTPVGILTEGLTATLFGVVAAVSYYELRRDKEGTAVEDLASIFE